jgi:hypothetical protein
VEGLLIEFVGRQNKKALFLQNLVLASLGRNRRPAYKLLYLVGLFKPVALSVG